MLTRNDDDEDFKWRSLKKQPLSVPVIEEYAKKHKIKRFHAFSIEEFNKELNLPRIPNRNPTSHLLPKIKPQHNIL